MIFPYIGLDCPPCEGLPVDRHYLTFSVHTQIGGGRHHEIHLLTLLPKCAGKFMRENQGIKAPFGRQQRDCILAAWPLWRYIGLKPTAELKAGGLGLTDQNMQHLSTCHSIFPKFPDQSFPAFSRSIAHGRGKDCCAGSVV